MSRIKKSRIIKTNVIETAAATKIKKGKKAGFWEGSAKELADLIWNAAKESEKSTASMHPKGPSELPFIIANTQPKKGVILHIMDKSKRSNQVFSGSKNDLTQILERNYPKGDHMWGPRPLRGVKNIPGA